MRFSLIFISFLLLFFSCKNEKSNTEVHSNPKEVIPIKYAKGFSVVNYKGFTKIKVNSPWPQSTKSFNYLLVPKGEKIPDHENEDVIINVPIEKVVVMSTTDIPSLEYLGVENRLVGFPNTNYISSEKTLQNIKNGQLKDIGSGQNINMELLLELHPELVIGFSVNGANKTLSKIEKFGIPVVLDGGWTEQHPLGRAEWIKFKALFFGKEKEADSIFKTIENNYLEAKKIALNSKKQPTVISGSLFKDVWNIPGGKSYLAKFFEDANTNYLWKNDTKTGSLKLNFENVLEKGHNADLWIGCGQFNTKEELIAKHQGYSFFGAYKENNIYTYTKKKGPNGGLLYFELGPLRPDLILKDLIYIAHPELLKNYETFFFKALD